MGSGGPGWVNASGASGWGASGWDGGDAAGVGSDARDVWLISFDVDQCIVLLIYMLSGMVC